MSSNLAGGIKFQASQQTNKAAETKKWHDWMVNRWSKEKNVEATDKELRGAIKRMIDIVEKRFSVDVFNPLSAIHTDTSINYEFIFEEKTALDPQSPLDLKRFHEFMGTLRKAFPEEENKEAAYALYRIDSLMSCIEYNAEAVG